MATNRRHRSPHTDAQLDREAKQFRRARRPRKREDVSAAVDFFRMRCCRTSLLQKSPDRRKKSRPAGVNSRGAGAAIWIFSANVVPIWDLLSRMSIPIVGDQTGLTNLPSRRKDFMTRFASIAHLKELLLGMERDLGIDDLGSIQKNIVYAATILSETNGTTVETDEIRKHALLAGVPRSSFFRAMKDVVDAGYLVHSTEKKRSTYSLSKKLT